MDQTTIVHTVFLISKIGSLFMCGYKAGLQQGYQGQQFCHYVSFLSGSQWSLTCVACHRCYLTPISNVCEAAHVSLFWAPNRLNELPEMRFEMCFNLIGELTVAFLMGQSWLAIKSWYTGGSAQNKGFGNQKLVLSVVQAMWRIEYCLYSCFNSPVKDTIVTNDRWCDNGCKCHHGGTFTCTDRYNPGKLLNCVFVKLLAYITRLYF